MSQNRVALVTGGGRGIGRAIARALGEQGWITAVNYHQNQTTAEQTVADILAQGGTARAYQADIRQPRQRQAMVDQLLTDYSRLDLLVNNAGMAPRQRRDILEASEDSFDEVMTTNLKGPYFLTQLVARKMIELIQARVIPEAKIINIGSISSFTSSTNRGEYCLSKAGLSMMTRLYADRLAEYGIQVYEICPGIIETEMTQKVMEKYDRLIAEGLTPIRRHGYPEDVARLVIAIAEDYLPYSTGEVIHVDGGFHLHRL